MATEMPESSMTAIQRVALGSIAMLFVGLSVLGLNWGLPGKNRDPFLFGDDSPWSGETIFRLAGGDKKFDEGRGADVDWDPLDRRLEASPTTLNATQADQAKIYLRFRLYSHQPDEMITLMALAGMRPAELRLDPKLYQYGGLFIYPIGALIKACELIGLIDVRADVAFYVDHPDEFGKFYLVARSYSAAWGVLGVLIVFWIGRQIGGVKVGLLAALLYTLMPVVICMAHEGKPHLPGAVLMLAAVGFAMRQLSLAASLRFPSESEFKPLPPSLEEGASFESSRVWGHAFPESPWWWMCVCCGAAVGMVLSAAPIILLVPLVACLEQRRWWMPTRNLAADELSKWAERTAANCVLVRAPLGVSLRRTVAGLVAAGLVYVTANPYVLVNALFHREVLQSNFGNSLAMYEIARLGEGMVRVLELTVDGATLPVTVLGVAAGLAFPFLRRRTAWPLAVSAWVFFTQFVLIGAGKPGEYGRFGVFTNTALAVAAAGAIMWHPLARIRFVRPALGLLLVAWTAWCGWGYLRGFLRDASAVNSRIQLARDIQTEGIAEVGLLHEPAPYNCPPMNFTRIRLLRYRSADQFHGQARGPAWLIETVDRPELNPLDYAASAHPTPISWADKPFRLERRNAPP